MILKNKIVGYHDNKPYFKLAGVDFLAEDLIEKLRNDKRFLYTSRGMYLITDEKKADIHNFKAKLLEKGKFMQTGRYVLWNTKESESYINKFDLKNAI